MQLTKISLGRSISGATVCAKPDHPAAPEIDVMPTKTIQLTNSQTYRISKTPDGGAAENMDLDEENLVAYVANDETGALDTYSLATSPVTPISTYSIDGDYAPTSTSVCKTMDRVAIAFAHGDDDVPGLIEIVTKNLTKIAQIRDDNCFLPDSVKWSDDCSYLVAGKFTLINFTVE